MYGLRTKTENRAYIDIDRYLYIQKGSKWRIMSISHVWPCKAWPCTKSRSTIVSEVMNHIYIYKNDYVRWIALRFSTFVFGSKYKHTRTLYRFLELRPLTLILTLFRPRYQFTHSRNGFSTLVHNAYHLLVTMSGHLQDSRLAAVISNKVCQSHCSCVRMFESNAIYSKSSRGIIG